MNNHASIQKLLAAYSSNDLPEIDRRIVERHLSECPACRAQLADLTTTLRLMRTTPEVDPPPWLTSRIMAHLREEQTAKRSWLQRIWFPRHTAFPVRILALLVVCVSGYYLSRSVETGLEQSSRQQLQEIPTQPTPAPVQSTPQPPVRPEKPTAPPQTSTSPAAVPQPAPPEKSLPTGPPPSIQSRPAPTTFAPAPPDYKDGYGNKAEAIKAAPAAESSNRSLEAAREMKSKSSRSSDSAAPPVAGRSAGAPAASALPQAEVRMQVINPETAPAMIREAILRSGGSITKVHGPPGQRLTLRIPATRQGELLERLQQLGRLTARPAAPPAGAAFLEMTIQW